MAEIKAFYQNAYDHYDSLEYELTDIECVMAEIGVYYEFPYNRIEKQKNVEMLMKHVN